MSNLGTEDLNGLVSPDAINLDDVELARSLPLVVVSLAVQQTSSDYFKEFLGNPMNSDTLPLLERFQSWIEQSISDVQGSSHDDWLDYLATSRAEALASFWIAYDPDGLTVGEPVRDVVGDELLGTALFFQFLESVRLVSDHDSQRWTNVWNFLTYTDLLSDDDEEIVEEATPRQRSDEW